MIYERGKMNFWLLHRTDYGDVLKPQGVAEAISRFQIRHAERFVDARDSGEHAGGERALNLPPLNLEELSEDLTKLALRLGSADNITVVCVAFEY